MVDEKYFPGNTYEEYLQNEKQFEIILLNLKELTLTKKDEFLNQNFLKKDDENLKEGFDSFVLQFIDWFDFLIFCKNDNGVINKLKELGFKNETIKWMIDINEIESEIRRLSKIEGILIFPLNILISSVYYCTLKFKFSLYDTMFGVIYNNVESNKLLITMSNLLRKRRYNAKFKRKNENSNFEDVMIELNEINENLLKSLDGSDNKNIRRFNKNIFSKKTFSKYIGSFNQKFLLNYSLNQYYFEIFPILKLVLKDEELLNEESFNKLTKGEYDDSYRNYKISRVKTIFRNK